jgi:hypothetical protein
MREVARAEDSMRRLLKIALAASALAVAAPAAAQYTFTQPGQPLPAPPEVWNNVARINLGVSFYNSGWYYCDPYYWGGYYYTCSSGSYVSYIPFTFGPQVDINLGGMNNLSLGLNISVGSVSATMYSDMGMTNAYTRSSTVWLWEPTVDYVAKFGPPTQDTVGRFRVGGAMYFGPNSKIGGAFRIGGGASFFNANRFGIGLDLVLEGGSYNGYWIGGLQLQASPEFHF